MMEAIEQLKEDLTQKENDCDKAVEIGRALLEENSKLTDQIDVIVKEYAINLENKEQCLHGLQMKLEQKVSMEEWYTEEMSFLKTELTKQKDDITDILTKKHKQEVGRLINQVNQMHTDLELSQNAERQSKEQLAKLEELFREKMNESVVSPSRSFSEDIVLAQEEIVELQNSKMNLKAQIIEMDSELKHCREDREALRSHCHMKNEEIESLQCQVTSITNGQERFRTEILDLKTQLEVLRMETNSHKSKGNSLFSEVDDRRVMAEKKLISLTIKVDTLAQKLELEKQQHSNLKMQMVMLLQMSKGRTDRGAVNSLQSRLQEAHQQIEELSTTINKLKSQKSDTTTLHTMSGEEQSSDKYVQYVQSLLQTKEKDMNEVSKQLQTTKMMLLHEERRVLDQQKNIYDLKDDKSKLEIVNVKLCLKNEELLTKYEPDSIKNRQQALVFKSEQINLDESDSDDGIQITESYGIKGVASHTSSRSVKPDTDKPHRPERRDSSKENEIIKPHTKSLSELLKNPKTKTVSISDNVTVKASNGEIKTDSVKDEGRSKTHKLKKEGVTRMREVGQGEKVQECNQQ